MCDSLATPLVVVVVMTLSSVVSAIESMSSRVHPVAIAALSFSNDCDPAARFNCPAETLVVPVVAVVVIVVVAVVGSTQNDEDGDGRGRQRGPLLVVIIIMVIMVLVVLRTLKSGKAITINGDIVLDVVVLLDGLGKEPSDSCNNKNNNKGTEKDGILFVALLSSQ